MKNLNKLITLTENQYKQITKGNNLNRELKKALQIPSESVATVGDTLVTLSVPTKQGEVFEYFHGSKRIVYIVIEPMDDKMAFCYSIY